MKRIINVSLMLLLCLTLVTGCGKNNEKDNNKDSKTDMEVNTNDEVIKDQNIDGIEITNTSLVYENGLSYFSATVTNNTGSDYELNEYKINVKDSEGNIIVIIPGNVGSTIKNGESKNINSVVTEDLSKAAYIEYEIVK